MADNGRDFVRERFVRDIATHMFIIDAELRAGSTISVELDETAGERRYVARVDTRATAGSAGGESMLEAMAKAVQIHGVTARR